jgi:hypothetical protein
MQSAMTADETEVALRRLLPVAPRCAPCGRHTLTLYVVHDPQRARMEAARLCSPACAARFVATNPWAAFARHVPTITTYDPLAALRTCAPAGHKPLCALQ